MAGVHSTLTDARAEGKVIPLRPRAEVSRGSNPLPPKSRRRYRRGSGMADGNIGRFQKPMRWAVFGKVIFPDLRPCWRCTLDASACVTCTNPRRADAQKMVPARVPLLIEPGVTMLGLVTALASAGLAIRHDSARRALVIIPVRQEGSPIT